MGDWKKALYLISAAGVFLVVFLSYVSGQTQDRIPDFNTKIHDGVKEQISESEEKMEVIVQTYSGNKEMQRRSLESIGNITHEYSSINSFSVAINPDKIDDIAKEDFVKIIEPNPVFKIQLQQSTSITNASVVWKQVLSGLNLTGKGFGICIIDTGVNYTHPDLGGCPATSDINTAGCSKVVGGYDFVNGDRDPMDDHGHGTHVAGIAAANGSIFGMAPGAHIVAIKSMNSAGSGSFSDIVAGIDWCISNATRFNISVISMSLGSAERYSSYCDNDYPSIAAAIDVAVANNISVTVASGNDGDTTGISSPACIRNATSVGSSTKSDVISNFTNRNSLLDLIAPGSSINSTSIDGRYVELSGTSMATPHVAGMFAILYQKYKILYGMNPEVGFIENISKSSGVRITDTVTGLSFPRIDVFNSSYQIQSTHFTSKSSNTTVERGYASNLSASWISNVKLDKAILSTNETGEFINISGYYGSPFNFSANSGTSVFSWSNSSLSNGTLVLWRIYANDSSGNMNVTDDGNFTVVDTSISITNITGSNGIVYSPLAIYTFNATVTDFTGIGTVVLEWNLSENETIYTYQQINSTSATYMANKTGLGFGNYTYRWIANDTLGNLNFITSDSFNPVIKAPTSVRILLNGTESNFTYDKSSSVNITAILNTTSVGNVSIIVNITGMPIEVNSSADTSSYLINTSNLTVGSYNVTAVYNGSNSNYLQSRSTTFFFIREAYRNSSVDIMANVLETLNASQLNLTLDFLTSETISGGEINVTIGTDNPVGENPPGIPIGKFIRINVSQSIAGNLSYSVIKYRYLDSEIPAGVDESTLRIFRWNGSSWKKFDGQFIGGVNLSENLVFANTTQFSDFSISGEATPPPAPSPSISSVGGGGGKISGGVSVNRSQISTKHNTSSDKPKAPVIKVKEENKTEEKKPESDVLKEKLDTKQVDMFDYSTVLTLILAATALGIIIFLYTKPFNIPRRMRRRRKIIRRFTLSSS